MAASGGLLDYLYAIAPLDHTTAPNELEPMPTDMAKLQTLLYFDQPTLPQGSNPTQWEQQEPENRNRDFQLSRAPSTTQRSAPRKSGQPTAVKRQKKRKHTHATQIKIQIEQATGTRDPSMLFTSRYDNRQEIEDRFFAVLMRDDFFPNIVEGEAMLVGVLNEMGYCESRYLPLFVQKLDSEGISANHIDDGLRRQVSDILEAMYIYYSNVLAPDRAANDSIELQLSPRRRSRHFGNFS
jgi:hypothetical protein